MKILTYETVEASYRYKPSISIPRVLTTGTIAEELGPYMSKAFADAFKNSDDLVDLQQPRVIRTHARALQPFAVCLRLLDPKGMNSHETLWISTQKFFERYSGCPDVPNPALDAPVAEHKTFDPWDFPFKVYYLRQINPDKTATEQDLTKFRSHVLEHRYRLWICKPSILGLYRPLISHNLSRLPSANGKSTFPKIALLDPWAVQARFQNDIYTPIL